MPLARPETLLVYLSNGTWLKRETHVVLRDNGKRVLLKGTPARPHPPTPSKTGFYLHTALNQKGVLIQKSCLVIYFFVLAKMDSGGIISDTKNKQHVLFIRLQMEGEGVKTRIRSEQKQAGFAAAQSGAQRESDLSAALPWQRARLRRHRFPSTSFAALIYY